MSLLKRSRPPKQESSPDRRYSSRTRARLNRNSLKPQRPAPGVGTRPWGRPSAGARKDRGRSPRGRCCCIIPRAARPLSLRTESHNHIRTRDPPPRPAALAHLRDARGVAAPAPSQAAGKGRGNRAAQGSGGEAAGVAQAGGGAGAEPSGAGPSGGGGGGTDPAGSRARGLPEQSGLSPQGGSWRSEPRLVRPGTQQCGSLPRPAGSNREKEPRPAPKAGL